VAPKITTVHASGRVRETKSSRNGLLMSGAELHVNSAPQGRRNCVLIEENGA